MRWQNQRRSDNIEDQRHQSSSPLGFSSNTSPLLRLVPILLKTRMGKWGLLLLAGVFIAGQLGIRIPGVTDALMPNTSRSSAPQISASGAPLTGEDKLADFVSVVLADTETTWHGEFAKLGRTYQEPKLVLFRHAVKSACGRAESAMGPFYCPADQKVYIDLSFYNDLRKRHGAPGDFAQAYVIAHEVGHHIQTLMGISQQVHQAKRSLSKVEGNRLSVKQELQADCLAGIWAHHAEHTRQLVESGDLTEALRAAAAIGDDRLQKQAKGYITPESFTHGSSEQRVQWFQMGYKTGRFSACDTFSSPL